MQEDTCRNRQPDQIRVVIADDYAPFREPLRAWLETQEPDFAVVGEAADGAEAIRSVRHLRPDILLLDVCMPSMDGLDVARALTDAVPATRIVVVTGYDHGRHTQAFVDLGVGGYLSKETPPAELATILRAVHAGYTCLAPVAARALRAPTGPAVAAGAPLTPREVEVLRLVAADRQNAEIAAELCVCVKTVESHVSGAMQKLGVRSRGGAVLKARDLNPL